MAREAGAMRGDIAQCDHRIGARIVEVEVFDIFVHRVIPIDLLLIGEHRHRRRRERFGR